MSEWIDEFVARTRQEITDNEAVLKALGVPVRPYGKRRRKRKASSDHTRELDVNLRNARQRVTTVAMREPEKAEIANGEREVVHATSSGKQDG